jgi:hypothetical protein
MHFSLRSGVSDRAVRWMFKSLNKASERGFLAHLLYGNTKYSYYLGYSL